MVHTSLSLAWVISQLFVFQSWTIFNVTLVMMYAGLTDQIRSLPQVTSHVTVETEVDTNLPPHSSRAKQTYNSSMLGWAQDTQQCPPWSPEWWTVQVSVSRLLPITHAHSKEAHIKHPWCLKHTSVLAWAPTVGERNLPTARLHVTHPLKNSKVFTTELWCESLQAYFHNW